MLEREQGLKRRDIFLVFFCGDRYESAPEKVAIHPQWSLIALFSMSEAKNMAISL